ncbi:MAG: GDSL-type esterase/lipase family protein [Verrucomicrobia bacterium]|nr:GDSL-type esterase/lipase family protein [Verrucomicrobiota bacterium]
MNMKSLAVLLTLTMPFVAIAAAPDPPGKHLDGGGTLVFAKPGDGGRSYLRTSRADFAKGDFQAEVTVTLKGGGGAGCAFFGIGCGRENPGASQEPSTAPSVYVRLAPGDFAGGVVTTSVNGQESVSHPAPAGDGTHRVRFTWDAAGKRALFEIDANWDGKAFQADWAATVPAGSVAFGDAGHLFVGGANGVRVADFAVKAVSPAQIQAAGFAETFSNDPTAGTWLAPTKGARFIEALRAGRKVTLATMGTSLTGGTWRWPEVMMNDWLNKEWPGQVTLCNEGVGASASSMGFNGDMTTSGLGKLDAVIAHKPDAVFIEFGTNDAFLPYRISLEDSKKNLNVMIDRLLAANPATEVILQTMNSCMDQPQPGGGKHATDRPQVAAYFEGYREVAKARGLLLVDHYPNWLKIMTSDLPLFDRLVPDRIHPQAEGYQKVLLPELKATLCPPPVAEAPNTAVGKLLEPLGGNLRLLACWYDGPKLAASRPFAAGELRTPSNRWTSEVRTTPVPNENDALDLAVTFKLAEGRNKSAGIAVAFDFAKWSANNYVLIPASVYNGNRNRIEYRGYCTGFNAGDFSNKDLPVTHGDVPRLELAAGTPSKIEVNASNASTPALCFYNRETKRGFIVLAEQGLREGGRILDHGLMNTFPMLALGDAMHRERAIKTFNFVMPAAVGKSGYFLASVYADGKAGGRDWYPKLPIVLTRQNADVLYWMTKQFMLLKAQGHAAAIKPAWEQAVRQLAQAFVNTWKRHGQWGNYVNHETGEIAIFNSTGGATAIGGLALAARYFNNPEFSSVAQAAADYYYQQDFLGKGFTYGACSDIMQNADSETAAGFMTALMTLHETTGERRWLEMSRNLANLAATWTVSYDYQLPANTELAQLGAKLAGVYWASTQNKHGAPGICTSSGDALFKIYRATGDRRYAELLRDIVHAHAEGIKPDGQITERLTYCDADSRGSRGDGSTGWNELNGILMAMELPGIYARTDTDEMFVFDHVAAQMLQRGNDGVTIKITNPTEFEAQVAVLTENAEQAQRPLGATAFLKWRKVAVKAGATLQVNSN